MNIAFITPDNWIKRVGERLEAGSRWTVTSVAHERTDTIIGMSISVMDDIEKALAIKPDARLFLYHWDQYSWTKTRPREGEYDFRWWNALCAKALEVWVPSNATVRQLVEDVPGVRCRRIKTFVPDLERFGDGPFEDKRFALMPLRNLPDDCAGWFERACANLNIPHVTTDHKLSPAEYDEAVETCSFCVSTYREASTGGLGLIEAAWCGKPLLINFSPDNGASDYVGRHATYFADDFESFEAKLAAMWNPPNNFYKPFPPPSREHIAKELSLKSMTYEIEERLRAVA